MSYRGGEGCGQNGATASIRRRMHHGLRDPRTGAPRRNPPERPRIAPGGVNLRYGSYSGPRGGIVATAGKGAVRHGRRRRWTRASRWRDLCGEDLSELRLQATHRDPIAGERVGDYEVEGSIARGGMASVLAVRDVRTGQ